MSKTGTLSSYPKVRNIGHAEILDLFDGCVLVQEKYDGSQLSWGWIDGELHVRSRGKAHTGGGATADKMFQGAVDYLSSIEPLSGATFRGEWFAKPKHNTLAYDRMPTNGIMLYDAEMFDSESVFYGCEDLEDFAADMGVEVARTFWLEAAIVDEAYRGRHLDGEKVTLEWLRGLLDNESTLGGVKIEGVAVKNYSRFTRDGKVMMGKLVSEAFKEVHKRSWKERHPSNKDLIGALVESLNTEARYEKAVQHLRDDGLLSGTPKDIGPLMVEVKTDTLVEESAWIKDRLYETFVKEISRGLGRGLPEWYKAKLAEEGMGR